MSHPQTDSKFRANFPRIVALGEGISKASDTEELNRAVDDFLDSIGAPDFLAAGVVGFEGLISHYEREGEGEVVELFTKALRRFDEFENPETIPA